jgi:hypothetical protein
LIYRLPRKTRRETSAGMSHVANHAGSTPTRIPTSVACWPTRRSVHSSAGLDSTPIAFVLLQTESLHAYAVRFAKLTANLSNQEGWLVERGSPGTPNANDARTPDDPGTAGLLAPRIRRVVKERVHARLRSKLEDSEALEPCSLLTLWRLPHTLISCFPWPSPTTAPDSTRRTPDYYTP